MNIQGNLETHVGLKNFVVRSTMLPSPTPPLQRCPHPNPWNSESITLMTKKTFKLLLKLRILR